MRGASPCQSGPESVGRENCEPLGIGKLGIWMLGVYMRVIMNHRNNHHDDHDPDPTIVDPVNSHQPDWD